LHQQDASGNMLMTSLDKNKAFQCITMGHGRLLDTLDRYQYFITDFV